MVRNEIRLLEKGTIDKIAAGEVIERPSSVVKELTENAIDADATAISVEIQDGGTTLIRVTDNGIGIPRDQIRVAFLRHSTSKLRTAEDLESVHSLGFRGEALASIAAVSEVELVTKCREEEVGSYFSIEGGSFGEIRDIGASDGTTFLVHHLFYNTPARKKFLKSDTTEGNYIQTLLEHLALSHPEISFHLKVNGKERLMTSGNGNTLDAVYAVFGREITRNLLEFHTRNDCFSVEGYIGKYTINRGNRNFENFFVNGRMVEDKILSKAVEDGYHGFLMQHQFPFVVLFFRFPDGSVDVNVHPSKREIRMDNGQEVYRLLSEAVHERLTRREDIQNIPLAEDPDQKVPVQSAEPFENKMLGQVQQAVEEHVTSEVRENLPEDFYQADSVDYDADRKALNMPDHLSSSINPGSEDGIQSESGKQAEYTANHAADKSVGKAASGGTPYKASGDVNSAPEQMTFLSEESRPYFHIVGQVFDTYWVIEFNGKVYIIDQHAAHEKVNYERMMKDIRQRTIMSQMILPPEIITLEQGEIEELEKYRDEFEALGFRFEPFGGKEYKLTGLPANLPDVDPKALFLNLISGMTEFGIHDTSEVIQEKIASMACKASIKGNQTISRMEAEELISELLQADEPYHCPHGRPTMISVTRQDLDKLFKRIV